jgi:hypothetical protein
MYGPGIQEAAVRMNGIRQPRNTTTQPESPSASDDENGHRTSQLCPCGMQRVLCSYPQKTLLHQQESVAMQVRSRLNTLMLNFYRTNTGQQSHPPRPGHRIVKFSKRMVISV